MPVKVYDGTNWVTVAGDGQAGAPGTSSSIATWVKTASGGETSVSGAGDTGYGTLAYTAGQELVYLNGVLLDRGDDYTATNGTSIAGLTALTAGDVVTVWTVNSFSVANTYTVAQADSTFAPISVTGGITLITSTNMAGVADVTFSTIAGTYKDLVVIIKNYYQAVDAGMKIELNGNTTSNNYEYTITSGRSTGSLTTYSNTNFLQDLTTEGADADNFMYLYFPDYTNTVSRKQIQNHAGFLSDNGAVVTQFGTHQFRSTAAITSIRIFSSSATNFTAGTVELYGVK